MHHTRMGMCNGQLTDTLMFLQLEECCKGSTGLMALVFVFVLTYRTLKGSCSGSSLSAHVWQRFERASNVWQALGLVQTSVWQRFESASDVW